MDKNTQGNVPVSNYKTARLDVYRDTRRCSTKQANFRKREKKSDSKYFNNQRFFTCHGIRIQHLQTSAPLLAAFRGSRSNYLSCNVLKFYNDLPSTVSTTVKSKCKCSILAIPQNYSERSSTIYIHEIYHKIFYKVLNRSLITSSSQCLNNR